MLRRLSPDGTDRRQPGRSRFYSSRLRQSRSSTSIGTATGGKKTPWLPFPPLDNMNEFWERSLQGIILRGIFLLWQKEGDGNYKTKDLGNRIQCNWDWAGWIGKTKRRPDSKNQEHGGQREQGRP